MRRSHRTFIILFVAFSLSAIVCVGAVYLLAGDDLIELGRKVALRVAIAFRDDDLSAPAGTDDTEIRFTVNPGDSARIIADHLLEEGLISDADLFVTYVRAEGLDVELEAGIFFLRKTQNIREVAQTLTESRFSQIDFTIVPGWRIEEVAQAIEDNRLFGFSGQDFLNLVGTGAQVNADFVETVGLPDGASLEGFLYPDTYALKPDITPIELRDFLLQAFLTNVGGQLFDQAAEQEFSMYEIVTLASIVQHEALHSDEMPRIAGVYRNRLTLGMKLDADPTVQYPLGTSQNWWPRITSAQYTSTISEYNTYLHDGLPPGPIASPSINAIRAALNPEEHDYLYFRADCRSDGYHDFAETYAQHVANGC